MRTYVNDSVNSDFVAAHLPNIDLYRPLVQFSFIFVLFMWQWPECDEAFADRFYACCACAFAQAVLCMYWFHVSFYSESSKCWDKMGWFVHTFVALLNIVAIPVFCMVNMSLSYSKEYAHTSPYQLVIVSYSCTAVLFAVRMLLRGK